MATDASRSLLAATLLEVTWLWLYFLTYSTPIQKYYQ